MSINLEGNMLPMPTKNTELQLQTGFNSDDLHLLTQPAGKKQFTIKGKIGFRCSMIPSMGLMQEIAAMDTQSEDLKQKKLEVKPVVQVRAQKDKERDMQLSVKLDPQHYEYVYGQTESVKQDKIRKDKNERRTRGDADDVRRQLFDLFKIERYWSLEALGTNTQQPAVFF